ncbi:MAG: hypothetical protein WA975_21235 [Mesorhizobium sp.]
MSGVLAAGTPLIAAQTTFIQGVQEAVQDWQTAVAQRALLDS